MSHVRFWRFSASSAPLSARDDEVAFVRLCDIGRCRKRFDVVGRLFLEFVRADEELLQG